jgi:hypothetical protein
VKTLWVGCTVQYQYSSKALASTRQVDKMSSILNIKRGLFGDVQARYKDPLSEWFYVTPNNISKAMLDELVETWIRHNEYVKDLEDEIFKEEEFLWKSRGLEDVNSDRAYISGLQNALKIAKEGA